MNRISRMVIVLVAVLSMGGSRALAQGKAEVGKPAPDFTLKATDGPAVSLSQYKGKTVVLEWTNPDCPFVQRHYAAGTMKTLAARYADKGVVWLAINTTRTATADINAMWAKKHDVTYPILDDHEGKVGLLYGAKATPQMFIIDAAGRLVYDGAIDDDPRGDKADRINYVQKALDELLAGKPVTTTQTRGLWMQCEIWHLICPCGCRLSSSCSLPCLAWQTRPRPRRPSCRHCGPGIRGFTSRLTISRYSVSA